MSGPNSACWKDVWVGGEQENRLLPPNKKTEIRRMVGAQARRRSLTKKNISQAKRKKPQKGRMSVRTGGWEVKKMTQLWCKHAGQDRCRKKKQAAVTDRTGRIYIGREAEEDGDKRWWKGTRAIGGDEKSGKNKRVFLSLVSLQTTDLPADSPAFGITASS